MWCLYVLVPCWNRNALRATTTRTFSISQLPMDVRCLQLFHFQMCYASQRHAIFHLSSRWLRTRRFGKPTFRPSRATNHWKRHSESRLFYPLVQLHLLSSNSFSSLILFLLLFSSLILPTSPSPSVQIVEVWQCDFKTSWRYHVLNGVWTDLQLVECHTPAIFKPNKDDKDITYTSSTAQGGGISFKDGTL